MKRPSKQTLLLIATVAAATIIITTFAAIWLSKILNLSIPSLGTIKTLGVEAYWDRNLTNKTETIKWGTIWPGSLHNTTFYIRSISNIETKLKLNTTNWNPSDLSSYMNLTWTYNGTVVSPSEVIEVTLTLSASSSYSFIMYLLTNDVKQFSLDIIINTQEYR